MHIPLLTAAYINAACPLQFKPLALKLATEALSFETCVRNDTSPESIEDTATFPCADGFGKWLLRQERRPNR
jgi:hypothetical protein